VNFRTKPYMTHEAYRSENEHYLSMASAYDTRLSAILPESETFFAEVLSFIPDQARNLLELGSGTGYATEKIQSRFNSIQIVGIDHSGEMIRCAELKPELNQVQFLEQDIRDPWPSGQFDVILTTLCFHHVPEQDRMSLLSRVYDALSPGGVFICGDIIRPESDKAEEIYRSRWIRSMESAGLSSEEITSIVTSRRANYGEMERIDTLIDKMRQAGFSVVLMPYRHEISVVVVGFKA